MSKMYFSHFRHFLASALLALTLVGPCLPVKAQVNAGLEKLNEWPTAGPKVLIGTLQEPYFVSLQAPEQFVHFAQSLLQGDPTTWVVSSFRDDTDARSGMQVTIINDLQGNMITIVVQPDRWTRIENPDGPLKPSFLSKREFSPENLKDQDKTIRWLVDLTCADPNTDLGLLMIKEHQDMILGANAESKDKLFGLIHDPIVTQQRMTAVISCNSITWKGAAYELTFIVQTVNPMKVLSIKLKVLYPKGTFFYPLAD